MPYTNLPRSQWRKMDRCVADVMKTGKDKDAAIGICYASITESAPLPDGVVLLPDDADPAHTDEVREAKPKRSRLDYEALEEKHELLKRKFRLMQQAIRMIVGLYGGNLEDLGALTGVLSSNDQATLPSTTSVTTPDQTVAPAQQALATAMQEALREAFASQNIADYLVASIHREFTLRADELFADGAMSQAERVGLSGAVGAALDAFNAFIDADPFLQPLRVMAVNPPDEPEPGELTPVAAAEPVAEGAPSPTPLPDNQRRLTEVVLSETVVDTTGRLDGVIVVEGESLNKNVYTPPALESGLAVFRGKPIFVDHPARSEEADRPERSVRDLVGRIDETYLGTDKAGHPALRYKGRLSQAESWLATKIREGILGDQSINAIGQGHEDPATGLFVVEGFADAISLDFVTRAAAGGYADLVEAAPSAQSAPPVVPSSTPSPFVQSAQMPKAATAASAPVQIIPKGGPMKISLHEAQRRETHLIAAFRAGNAQVRKTKAEQLVNTALAESGLPKPSQARVRKLVEADVRRFAEADEPIAPVGSGMSAGDPPTIEIPPDVAELPPEGQSVWLTAYTDSVASGPDQAVHMAWAAVYSAGYYKDESGAWQKEQSGDAAGLLPAASESVPPETALQAAVAEAIKQEREYLAAVTSAGRVQGMGGGDREQPDPAATTEARVASFRKMGLTEAEAKIAVTGRRE